MAQIIVNRAPFLTLWATVVARRLGYGEEEALSLAKAFTGLTAQSKAQRLGLSQPRPEHERERIQAEREAKGAEYVEFLDRLIPVIRTEKGLQALSGTSPISPESTRRYPCPEVWGTPGARREKAHRACGDLRAYGARRFSDGYLHAHPA